MDQPVNRWLSLRGRTRVWLGVVVLAWGIQAIVTQSLLLREALVLMFGSELAWGIVLFAWLFGVAVGGVIGGWLAPRLKHPDVGLVGVLMILSVAACFELWAFRGARAWLSVDPGELLPLTKTVIAALLLVSPVSALVGLAFPLACCINLDPPSAMRPGSGPLGRVYALESAGSLIGGAAFSFWAVEHLAPIETTLICLAMTAVASGGLLAVTRASRYAGFGLGAVAGAVVAVVVLAGDTLNERLIDRRWRNIAPGYELCTEMESKYQNLAIGRRAGQFTLYCNGQVSTDFPDPYTYVPLAHFWMCQHPRPRTVLVLGGGAEGLLQQILQYPIEHVYYVEPDPCQIKTIEPFLTDADRRALNDQRVTIVHQDARYFIKTQQERFDLVIARLPEPTSALRARLYTEEFYGELRAAMTPRSVLCMTAAAMPANLSTVSAEYLASIRATLRRSFKEVIFGWGDPAQVLAGTEAGLISTQPSELADRYSKSGVHSDLFDPLWFKGATDWLDADKLRQRAAELEAADNVQISTDLRPIVYVQRLIMWERMTGGQTGRFIERLRAISLSKLIMTLVIIACIYLLANLLWHRRRAGWATGAITLSIGTTGFATMALSIVWLFAFQNLYGYVYQRIGWIIAVFMGGLVIGCLITSRRSERFTKEAGLHKYLWQRLIAVDVLLAILALFVPIILPVLGGLQTSRLAFVLVEWAVLIMVALTGVLGGSAFALAGGLQLAAIGQPGAAAGSIVGADHLGACVGALLTGIMLVPVYGTATTAFLLVGMKLASTAVLALAWSSSRLR